MLVNGGKKMFRATTLSILLAMATSVSAQTSGLHDGHLTALDADGDASISKAEFEAFTQFAFQEMDTNNSGSLTSDEVSTHFAENPFVRIDTNGDGVISESEFSERMDTNFVAADKDNNGVLD